MEEGRGAVTRALFIRVCGKVKPMHNKQIVADMANEVLARQAARARRSGETFGEALGAVLRSEAGRQLQELRDGVHGSERADEWQEGIAWERAQERPEALG